MSADTTLLTDTEASRLLRMQPSRLRRLANRGDIPHIRLPGGDVLFDPRDLARWIDEHRQPASDGGQP